MKCMAMLVIAGALASYSVAGVAEERVQPEESRMAGVESGLQSGYVTINGMDVYYEVHGQGKPLAAASHCRLQFAIPKQLIAWS